MATSLSKSRLFSLCLASFLCLASLALMCTSLATDHWFRLEWFDSEEKQTHITSGGLWRTCHTILRSGGWKNELCQVRDLSYHENMSFEEERNLHLERSHAVFIVGSACFQLIVILTLMGGLFSCPGCKSAKQAVTFFAVSILQLTAAILGIIGSICFIALRDLEEASRTANQPGMIAFHYDWSFMLAWISVGLCFIESAIFVLLVKFTYDAVYQSGKFEYYTM